MEDEGIRKNNWPSIPDPWTNEKAAIVTEGHFFSLSLFSTSRRFSVNIYIHHAWNKFDSSSRSHFRIVQCKNYYDNEKIKLMEEAKSRSIEISVYS